MNFVLIANAWSAGEKNPTSKHRIALELARRGHRVLWIEGSGMRTPSLGSGSDRGRMLRKVAAAMKGARFVVGAERGREEWPQEAQKDGKRRDEWPQEAQKAQEGDGKNTQHSTLNSQRPTEERSQTIDHRPETRDCRPQTADRRTETAESGPLTSDLGLPTSGGIWVLSPLLVPFPRFEFARRFNGWLCASMARRWCRKLGFGETVLINYVPVLAEAMRVWRAY